MTNVVHHPIEARFFPYTRLGLVAGIVIGLATGLVVREVHDDIAPPDPVSQAVASVVAPPSTSPAVHAIAPEQVVQQGRLQGPAVVNVWLESCPDCMPAFRAWKELVDAGVTKDMTLVNVAYNGVHDAAFAESYRVNQNVVEDKDGSLVVQSFGISSFTTLVIDARGEVVMRDRPGNPGFERALGEAWARVRP